MTGQLIMIILIYEKGGGLCTLKSKLATAKKYREKGVRSKVGAGTATAEKEKTGTRRFTCLNCEDMVVVVQAASPAMVAEKVAVDLIVEGTLESIGAKKIEELPRVVKRATCVVLKPDDVCTLVVGDPRRITDAVFIGEQNLNGATFLFWRSKENGVRFWTYPLVTWLTRVGGQKV